MTIRVAAIVLLCLAGALRAENPWPVKFADSTVVELVGIAENGEGGAKWWAADGANAADPQFQSNGMISGGGRPGAKSLQLIVKTNGDLAGKSLVVRVEPDFDQGLLAMRDTTGQMMRVIAGVPLDKPTFNVRFGLASGDWTENVLWQRPAGPTTQPADATHKFLGITEEGGQTKVQIKLDKPAGRGAASRRMISSGSNRGGPPPGASGGGGGGSGGQMRGSGPMGSQGGSMMSDLLFGGSKQDQRITLVARGRKLQPSGFEGGADGLLTLTFRCPIAQVEKVILATRAYEWMEMQNVSAKQTDVVTQVKVGAVTETIPSTGTPPRRD